MTLTGGCCVREGNDIEDDWVQWVVYLMKSLSPSLIPFALFAP